MKSQQSILQDFDVSASTCIFASSGLDEPAHIFLYGGNPKSKTGDILQCTPIAHFNLNSGGDNDFVDLDTNFQFEVQLFQPYAHQNSSNKQEYKGGASCQPLDYAGTSGAFNIYCAENSPSIKKAATPNVEANTFVFNIKGLTTHWKIRITTSLNGRTYNVQEAVGPIARICVYAPVTFKAFLIQNASTNLGPILAGHSTPKYEDIVSSIEVIPGQVISVALKDQDANAIQLKTWDANLLLEQANPSSSSTNSSFQVQVD